MDKVLKAINILKESNLATKNMLTLEKVMLNSSENNLRSILDVKLELKVVYNVLHG